MTTATDNKSVVGTFHKRKLDRKYITVSVQANEVSAYWVELPSSGEFIVGFDLGGVMVHLSLEEAAQVAVALLQASQEGTAERACRKNEAPADAAAA